MLIYAARTGPVSQGFDLTHVCPAIIVLRCVSANLSPASHLEAAAAAAAADAAGGLGGGKKEEASTPGEGYPISGSSNALARCTL